jgi:hypothetical protein
MIGGARARNSDKGIHNTPDRAEQPNERRRRADSGESVPRAILRLAITYIRSNCQTIRSFRPSVRSLIEARISSAAAANSVIAKGRSDSTQGLAWSDARTAAD